jgi:DNA-binding CsgD family transcriptional regulator
MQLRIEVSAIVPAIVRVDATKRAMIDEVVRRLHEFAEEQVTARVASSLLNVLLGARQTSAVVTSNSRWARKTQRPAMKISARRPGGDRLDMLSGRERQVLAHLAQGQSTREMALALGVAQPTVRVLLARAAKKLGVRSRAALVRRSAARSSAEGRAR